MIREPLACRCIVPSYISLIIDKANRVGSRCHDHLETTLLYNASIKKANEWNYSKLYSLNNFKLCFTKRDLIMDVPAIKEILDRFTGKKVNLIIILHEVRNH